VEQVGEGEEALQLPDPKVHAKSLGITNENPGAYGTLGRGAGIRDGQRAGGHDVNI
jgi:hypothetical protein